MSPKRLEIVAIVLLVAVFLLEGLCVVWLRTHYIGLFGAASSPRPVDLSGSIGLMWAMGLSCLLAASGAAYLVVKHVRTWLMVVLLPLCFLGVFVPTAVIYAMLVIQGWV